MWSLLLLLLFLFNSFELLYSYPSLYYLSTTQSSHHHSHHRHRRSPPPPPPPHFMPHRFPPPPPPSWFYFYSPPPPSPPPYSPKHSKPKYAPPPIRHRLSWVKGVIYATNVHRKWIFFFFLHKKGEGISYVAINSRGLDYIFHGVLLLCVMYSIKISIILDKVTYNCTSEI